VIIASRARPTPTTSTHPVEIPDVKLLQSSTPCSKREYVKYQYFPMGCYREKLARLTLFSSSLSGRIVRTTALPACYGAHNLQIPRTITH
jgi:hypothetical protein